MILEVFGSGDCCRLLSDFWEKCNALSSLNHLWLCFPFAGFEAPKGGRSQVVELGWESAASAKALDKPHVRGALLQAQIWVEIWSFSPV